LARADSAAEIEEVAADKGYHKLETLAEFAAAQYRTYIPRRNSLRTHVDGENRRSKSGRTGNNRRRVRAGGQAFAAAAEREGGAEFRARL